MRVLIITEGYPPQIGGVAASASRLANGLAQRLADDRDADAQVHVIHVSDDVAPGQVDTDAQHLVTRHQVGRIGQPDAQLQMLGNVLTRIHGEVGFDLLHGFYLTYSGYLAAFYAKLFGIGSCVSVRGNDVDRDMFLPARLPLIQYALQRAGAVTCVSTELVQKVEALSGRADAHFVANSVDADQFRPLSLSQETRAAWGVPDEPVVGFVGEMRFKKGFAFLLEAAAALDATCHVLLVGPMRRGEKDLLHDFTDAHPGLKDRIHSVPAVTDREQIVQLYNLMDVVLCPSLWDGMPNSVLEAMACGRVVLASDAGGIRDLVRHGDTGFLISRHELHRLGDALREVLALPECEREHMGQRGRQHVQTHHAPQAEVDAFSRIYAALLE